MNENESSPAQRSNGSTPPARKAYAVFTIVEIEKDRALWRRVGNGYVNRDGSYNLYLDALPLNGRLHMRESENAPQAHERS